MQQVADFRAGPPPAAAATPSLTVRSSFTGVPYTLAAASSSVAWPLVPISAGICVLLSPKPKAVTPT